MLRAAVILVICVAALAASLALSAKQAGASPLSAVGEGVAHA